MKTIGARKRQQTFDISIKNMLEYNFEDNLEKEVRILGLFVLFDHITLLTARILYWFSAPRGRVAPPLIAPELSTSG